MQVFRGLVERYPSLSPLLTEQLDYVLSSLQRMDTPSSDGRRPLVVAVVGYGHMQHVLQNWDRQVDRRALASKDKRGRVTRFVKRG